MRSYIRLVVLALASSILESTALPNASSSPQSAPIGSSENFQPNPSIGGGGGSFKDSAHFRVYGAPAGKAEPTLAMMEAAYDCFVNKLGWRTSGLSIKSTDDSGQKFKENIYAVASLGAAAGQMFSDQRTGYSYVKVIMRSVADPSVTVHEYGHALTYHERNWVDMKRTGVWWEPLANWFADTYINSPLCAESRAAGAQTPAGSRLAAEAVPKLMNNAHQTIIDGSSGSGNYYQVWPFFTYLTNNPDKFPGLGTTAVRDMQRKYKRGSNETPLHALATVAAPIKVSSIVGHYWAHMAFMDMNHKPLKQVFDSQKSRLNFANLDPAGSGSYKVKAGREPKYMGSNIIPLKPSGEPISISVKAASGFTAVVGVSSGGKVVYTELQGGSGNVEAAVGSEVKLVVVNTPAEMLLYDGFQVKSGPVSTGLQYTLQLQGATA